MLRRIGKCLLKVMLGCMGCILLAGCGHVKTAKSLIRQARASYGDCEVVSKTETEDRTEVVLRDKLQGFEYTMSSYMQDINIDGSSFGSLPSTLDGFSNGLYTFVMSSAEEEIREAYRKYHIPCDTLSAAELTRIKLPEEVSEEDGIKAAQEVAAAIQKYNLKNRMDGQTVYLQHDEAWLKALYQQLLAEYGGEIPLGREGYIFSSAGGGEACHIGSVKLPDCTFRDIPKEKEDYYLEMAQMKNSHAVFVRSEEKKFSDTGLPLERVTDTYYQDFPEEMSDPVMYYYFKVGNREFFLCDFLDADTGAWYTNYDSVFEK